MGVAPRLSAAAAALALVACGPADPAFRPERVAERLVTPGRMAEALSPAMLVQREAEAPETAGLASALLPSVSLGGDTRLVLFRYPSALLAYRQRVAPGAGSRLTIDLPVPPSLAQAPRLLTVARVLAGERWQDLPGGLTPVQASEARRVVALDEVLPAGVAQRGDLELIVQAFDPADGGRTELRSQTLEIPANAVLDFATGILEPALGQGPVRFSVSACVDGDCRSVFSQVVGGQSGGASAWHDASVSLHEFAGARASLFFETALVGDEPGRFSLPVWANPTILTPSASGPAPRSIVMISVDTLRADHLGSYGYTRGTSPGLDRLAAAGTVFENLVAEAATTDPSHMTMFTSVAAAVHGVTSGWLGLSLPLTTLAERLRAAGYLTAAFTEDGPMAHARGFGRGFDVYGENQSPDLVEPEGYVAMTFTQGRRWLERNGGRPFFLFLHTFQVHSPYAPPPAYRDRFVADGSDWIRLGPEQQSFRGAAERNAADYDREIRFVDDELSALVDWMQAQGLFANTTLLVLSDHGEQFYEHGELGHGTLPYEEVLRPPLIAYGAGIPPRRVSTPVT
ncbi:MAG: sulfatase, partial [Myxococcota bacterium]